MLKRWSGLVAALVFSLPVAAGTFPQQPTTLQSTYLTVTYSCPYPLEGSQPEVEIDGELIRVNVTLRGNVCFDGDHPELVYAFELGELPAGDYDLELRHRTDSSQGRFIPPVFQQSFSVIDEVTPRISGLWSDSTGLGHTLSVTFTDSDEGVMTWQTYDRSGSPFWVSGPFAVDGTELIGSMRSFRGMNYGSFDPNSQRTSVWGTVRMDILGCDSAVVRARSDAPGFGNAAIFMSQLATTAGLEGCEPDADAIIMLDD